MTVATTTTSIDVGATTATTTTAAAARLLLGYYYQSSDVRSVMSEVNMVEVSRDEREHDDFEQLRERLTSRKELIELPLQFNHVLHGSSDHWQQVTSYTAVTDKQINTQR